MTSNDQTLWMQTTDTLKNTHQLVNVQSFTAAVLRLNTATQWAMDIESSELRSRAMDCIADTASYLADEMSKWGVDPDSCVGTSCGDTHSALCERA